MVTKTQQIPPLRCGMTKQNKKPDASASGFLLHLLLEVESELKGDTTDSGLVSAKASNDRNRFTEVGAVDGSNLSGIRHIVEQIERLSAEIEVVTMVIVSTATKGSATTRTTAAGTTSTASPPATASSARRSAGVRGCCRTGTLAEAEGFTNTQVEADVRRPGAVVDGDSVVICDDRSRRRSLEWVNEISGDGLAGCRVDHRSRAASRGGTVRKHRAVIELRVSIDVTSGGQAVRRTGVNVHERAQAELIWKAEVTKEEETVCVVEPGATVVCARVGGIRWEVAGTVRVRIRNAEGVVAKERKIARRSVISVGDDLMLLVNTRGLVLIVVSGSSRANNTRNELMESAAADVVH